MDYNKLILAGRITKDPEVRYAKSGITVTKMGIAVNSVSGTAEGRREDVLFLDITAFGRTAELAGEYLHKGSAVLVEGRLQYETWESQDGQKRSKHTMVVDKLVFVDRKGQDDGGRRQAPDMAHTGSTHDDAPAGYDEEADIPF